MPTGLIVGMAMLVVLAITVIAVNVVVRRKGYSILQRLQRSRGTGSRLTSPARPENEVGGLLAKILEPHDAFHVGDRYPWQPVARQAPTPGYG
jgi:hypothetical protein